MIEKIQIKMAFMSFFMICSLEWIKSSEVFDLAKEMINLKPGMLMLFWLTSSFGMAILVTAILFYLAENLGKIFPKFRSLLKI